MDDFRYSGLADARIMKYKEKFEDDLREITKATVRASGSLDIKDVDIDKSYDILKKMGYIKKDKKKEVVIRTLYWGAGCISAAGVSLLIAGTDGLSGALAISGCLIAIIVFLYEINQ